MRPERVLVTGGSGFLAAHTIVALLRAGYQVRTTVRSLAREAEVRDMVAAGGVEVGDVLSFSVADLTSDDGWAEAVDGCDYVLHVASPFPAAHPENEDDVIVPAREGTVRVLRAARDAGVKRVVLTSSFAAIGYGHDNVDRELTEDDWTNVDGPDVTAYIKSKPLAERAAWDFINWEGGQTELTVINPVGILGPILGRDLSTSTQLIHTLITGGPAALPNIAFPVVDVRDAADIHLIAMTHPVAPGERFIACSDGSPITMREAARILHAWTGADTVDDTPVVGDIRRPSNYKAKTVLGWTPRSIEEALTATAESLVDHGPASPPREMQAD
jgi:nucleoside-diphosphate-sugar epimerase